MSTQYRAITNACLAVVILSALIFDRAEQWAPLVGAVGISAGVVAVATYIRRNGTRQSMSSHAQPHQYRVQDVQQQSSETRSAVQLSAASELAAHEGAPTSPLIGAVTRGHHNVRNVDVVIAATTYTYVVHQQRNNFAETVAAIVDRLCAESPRSYEFIVTSSGQFHIRATSESKRATSHSKQTIGGQDITSILPTSTWIN